MKKILFLPFLQMRSGHHQVAEALMDCIKETRADIEMKKVDLLSYSNPHIEKLVTKSYLNWIRYAPATYNLAYKTLFNKETEKSRSFKVRHYFFLKKMEQLLVEEEPDLIVCTHGFPSYLLSELKRQGKCEAPVMNAYTDFFVNSVWGREEIEYHLLPTPELKREYGERYRIAEQRMMVTGIPVHHQITGTTGSKSAGACPKVLMAGGNSGLGCMMKQLEAFKKSSPFDLYVLCGNNHALYEELQSWNADHINPLPYLSSREEMNELYDEVDAIVTKPGGVTISEALHKKLPIFVQSVLPGQEEINMRYLTEKGLVFKLNQDHSLEQELLGILMNRETMDQWKTSIQLYQNGIETEGPKKVAEFMNSIIEGTVHMPPSYEEQAGVYGLARA